MKQKDFAQEKEFINLLRDIKRKRKDDEIDLHKALIDIVNKALATDRKKDMLIKFINGLDKDMSNLNPLIYTTIINIAFSKLIFIYKSKDNGIPSELLIPLLNFKVDVDVWLDNMKDSVVPFMLNSDIFDVIRIEGVTDDKNKK